MLEEIRDELFRIGEKAGREKLFELSPVYLLSGSAGSRGRLQYLLSGLLSDLEKKEIVSSRSHIFLCFSLEYNGREAQSGLYDESGAFRSSLEQWLSYVNLRYHFEHGIILIYIRHYKDTAQDRLWRKQFFSDIRKYKKDFMFFVSCGESDAQSVRGLLEKEVFTMTYELDDFTPEGYFHWFIAKLEEYRASLDEAGKTELRGLLLKYEHDIDHHILELWLNALLWSCYGSGNDDAFLPPGCLSEELLVKTINACKRHGDESDSKIGFL